MNNIVVTVVTLRLTIIMFTVLCVVMRRYKRQKCIRWRSVLFVITCTIKIKQTTSNFGDFNGSACFIW